MECRSHPLPLLFRILSLTPLQSGYHPLSDRDVTSILRLWFRLQRMPEDPPDMTERQRRIYRLVYSLYPCPEGVQAIARIHRDGKAEA